MFRRPLALRGLILTTAVAVSVVVFAGPGLGIVRLLHAAATG